MSFLKLSVSQRRFALLSILCVISIGSILIRFSEDDIPTATYHLIGVLEQRAPTMGNSVNTSYESKVTEISRIPLRKTPRFRPTRKCGMPHGKMLIGRLQVNQSVPDMEDIASSWNEENWVVNGGAWRPITCLSVSKVAIIIPYRDRYPQLKIFLRHMHPILKRQLLDYRIIVVEQNGNTIFNRAMLFNIGYKEALKFHDFQCFVFHDVDLLPEDDRNYYGCPSRPRHLSVAVDTMKYRLPYATIFGGVGVLTKEQFEKINGFSNQFWGWGGEDDDLYKRIRAVNYTLSRPMIELGRYTMVRVGHKSAPKDPKRHEKLRNSKNRMTTDGLNSLKYEIVKTNEYQLYTQITVNVDPNAV